MAIVTGDQATAADVNEAIPGFHEVWSSEQQNGSNTTWQDWDISGIVPVGTKSVLVIARMDVSTDTTKNFGVRRDGSSTSRLIGFNTLHHVALLFQVECETTRIIEIYSEVFAITFFRLVGYWTKLA